MTAFTAEIIGTAVLVLLGNGVVANVVLNKTKGNGGGWMVITTAWALAVYVGVVISGPTSGAHLNPAVTVGLATAGKFAWNLVPEYILAQMLGALLGAFFVWLFYKDHYKETADAGSKQATFCTAPAIRNNFSNLVSEIIGTFLLGVHDLLFHRSFFWRKKWSRNYHHRDGLHRRIARSFSGLGDRIVARRHYRLCYQSCQGPGPAHHACLIADTRQGL